MAEQLTSSDIWRQQAGFGVSPDTASRQRAVASGVAPLTTEEIFRRERGWGPSEFAAPESRRAFQAAEVIERGGPISELPEEYGGRPIVASRRAMRMAAEWDALQQNALENQRLMQQMDFEQKRLALSERSQALQEREEARMQAAEAKSQDEALKVSEQADFALNEVLGGFDISGNPITGLNPDDPDYIQRRNDIIKRYPKALKDDAFKTAIATTDKSYFDTLNFQQQQQLQEKSAINIAERQEAASTRGEKERVAIREEERVAAEERDIKKKESDLDKQIREQRQVIVGSQGQTVTKTQQNQIAQARNKLLDLRIEKADLRGLYFEDQEAYKQAIDAGKKPPAGTTIYIGRKQVKVK